MSYWLVKLDFAEGQTVPTAEQVEAYIRMAESELGPACGDATAVWCAEVLRKAVKPQTVLARDSVDPPLKGG